MTRSGGGAAIGDRRSRSADRRVLYAIAYCYQSDMLVYCHEALYMQQKLQSASYRQQAAKWDSDSDSDETDEEDLKV